MNFDDSVGLLNKACRDTFGTPFVYVPNESRTAYRGKTFSSVGIAYTGTQTENLGDRLIGVSALVTTLDLNRADLEIPPARGDSIILNNVVYRILDIAPVSDNEALLSLVKKTEHPSATKQPRDRTVRAHENHCDAQDYVQVIAGQQLFGQRVVRIDNGKAYLFDSDEIGYIGEAVGITTGSASIQSAVTIQTMGVMSEPSWSFTPGRVWVGKSGILTQTPPVAGIQQAIGRAIDATVLSISIEVPILLA